MKIGVSCSSDINAFKLMCVTEKNVQNKNNYVNGTSPYNMETQRVRVCVCIICLTG